MCKPAKRASKHHNSKNTNTKKHSIKSLVWNINNFQTKISGNKLLDNDFLTLVDQQDIVALVETHAKKGVTMDIPGFCEPFRKDRPLTKKCNKAHGGIAVFVKQDLIETKAVTEVKRPGENVLWLKIKKEFLGEHEDIFIGTVYFSPQTKKNKTLTESLIYDLATDIMHFEQLGNVILQGDFNARTNNATDHTDNSKDGNIFDLDEDLLNVTNPPNTRNSLDHAPVNKRGQELLDLCKGQNLLILNGRKPGDLFGAATCYT